jgi:hypothetical protein
MLRRSRLFARPPGHRHATAAIAALAACTALAAALPAAGVAQVPQTEPTPVTLRISGRDPGRPVPRDYLGLSFEAAALDELAPDGQQGDLVALMRSLGPGVLRFGGVTADENVAWSEPGLATPAWASATIDEGALRGIGTLVRRAGWKVLLTVGLAHYEPAAAAREVAAAKRAIGAQLEAIEIGNEPNSYGAHGYREGSWLTQGYEEEVGSYREAIAALTPGVRIAGPDVSGSGIFADWGEAEALAQAPALLTGHHYPLGCAQTPPPSIEALLSPVTRHREAGSLTSYLHVARVRGIPLRIDEANSVSCGGVAGISNTFASALWAAGYITETMAAGAAGINLQGNPTNCVGYTPLCAPTAQALAGGALTAAPDWYALLFARSLLGAAPLQSRLSAARMPNLVAAPFLGPERDIRVALVDDEPPGSAPLSVRMRVGAGYSAARVLRLTGPSLTATSGVRLGGRGVAGDGTWRAPRSLPVVAVHGGRVTVSLPPSSAALVTVMPGAGPGHAHAPPAHG